MTRPMTYEKGVAMIDGVAVKLSKDMSGHESRICVFKGNLSSQDQVSKYLWSGSYHSVLGWICSKQVLFGVR